MPDDAIGPSGAQGEAVVPQDLKLKLAEQKLYVAWKDGAKSVYDLAILRRECPCATCRTEREERQKTQNPLTILKKDPVGIRAIGAHLVGHYAIQIEWSDGHNTGIYDFRLLRSLSDR